MPKKRLAQLGEFGLIEKLQKKFFLKTNKPWRLGIGDDAAWASLHPKSNLTVSKDLLIEGVHFLSGTTRDFEDLGWKSLAINLSDLAAMGSKPLGVLVGLGLPSSATLAQVEGLYRGLKECSEKFNCPLVGGDTNRSPQGWLISVTVLGLGELTPLLRSGAQVGDSLWVTGELGSAALGWQCIQKGDRRKITLPFRHRHARPEPRLSWALDLAKSRQVSSMIDVSDGLAGDVRHLSQSSQVGFEIELSALPRMDHFSEICQQLSIPEYSPMLGGGEDYELLFTVKQNQEAQFKDWLKRKKIAATLIGKVIQGRKIFYKQRGKPLKIPNSWLGFRHF